MNDRRSNAFSRRTVLRTSLLSAGAAALAGGPLSPPASASQASTPAATPGGDRDALYRDLEAFIARRMEELQVPGVSIAVVDGDTEWTAAYGVTNLDHPIPVTPETLFQIGSTTKTITGTAAMWLVEQGRLDIDAPVRDYLPGFRVADEAASETVLIRHLMTHGGGWFGDDLSETGDGDDALATYVDNMAALPQIFPVGEYFSYSNSGVDLLGRVIEVITGQTYEAAATELVLAPLGMTASTYFAEAVMTRAFAVGHTASPEAPDGPPVTVPEWAIPRASNPAGGLISNLPDQVRYLRFHLGDGEAEGGRVLQPETMLRMQEPRGPGGTLGPVVLDGFGVLWMLSTVGGLRVVEHGGSTNGQQSAFMLVPERQFGVTVLTNADSGAALGEEVKDWLLERALDAPRVMPSPAPYPAGTREEYAGTYDFGPEQQAVVSVDGDALSLAVVGQELRLDWVGEDVVSGTLLGSPFLFDFVRDDAGQVAWFRVSGRMAPKAG